MIILFLLVYVFSRLLVCLHQYFGFCATLPLPSLITDHVIIPELKLAFVTENDYAKFASTERRVHSRRFVALKKLHLSNERMKFNRKAAASLLESAAATLQKAQSVHDELEAFYIGAMDFKALDSYYEGFLKNI